MAGVDGTQKIMEHIHLQPGNWSCWGAQGLIYGTPESCSWLLLEQAPGRDWGWENSAQEPDAQENGGGHSPGPPCPWLCRQSQSIPSLLQILLHWAESQHNGLCWHPRNEQHKKGQGLKLELMCLKFGSIKVILHSATGAMGQWKQIAVHCPNRRIKTQEAAECWRRWPWLHNLANLCCLWGCTAVREKTLSHTEAPLLYPIPGFCGALGWFFNFLKFYFIFAPDSSLCF